MFTKEKDKVKSNRWSVTELNDGIKITNDGMSLTNEGLKLTIEGLKLTVEGLNSSTEGMEITNEGIESINERIQLIRTSLIINLIFLNLILFQRKNHAFNFSGFPCSSFEIRQ